jgi:hypothetical protein
MNNFEHYLRQVNEKSIKDFPFQLYHSKNNMRTAKGFNSKDAALKYAMDDKIDQFDIFRNGSGFHSTTQDEFLVLWADKNGGGYFSNRSKKEPELLKKKFEINEAYGPSLSKIARKSVFTIDALDVAQFPGFTFGANWNGWAAPYFEKEVADMIMTESNKINGPEYQMIFKNDSYTVGTDGDEETTDKQVIMTEDGEKTVWAVGAFSWCWQEKDAQNESTTFNVPSLIQLYYVEDANKRAVGLYKDLETAERMEMTSKGKKHIIDVDRDDYNNGKINASNAKYHIRKNESGEMVPVQAGEIIKLQKPAQDSYTNNTVNNDGLEIADCTVCGATGVVVGQHICKTVIDPTDQVPSEYNMVENMEMDEHLTDVLFLVEKDGEDEDVFAYFPNEISDEAGKFRTAYSHVGQHSGCDPKYAEECREAMPIHYKSLQEELTQLGYNLNVLNAPTTVSERFDSIRSKYGIKESKMITKLEWFKYIAESPMNDNTGDDMKHIKSGLSMTPEQSATEAERLFGRYNTTDIMEEVSDMFPDYKTSELEDAVNHILDTIYDAENMEDYVWSAVKPILVEKFNTLLTAQ